MPVAAYLVAARIDGRNAGLVAGLAVIWLTAVIRKVATGSVPGLLTISALVLTVQTGLVLVTGELWLFLLQFPLANLCMCVLFARTAGGPDPLVARLAAEVVALRQPATRHPGLHRFFQGATWLWAGIFLLLTVALAVLMVTEPTDLFLLLSTIATAALVVAGTGASTLVVPGSAAQARAQAPFCSRLRPAAVRCRPWIRASPPAAGRPRDRAGQRVPR